MTFRVLPEYIFEDVVETLLFYARYSPSSLALSGKHEIVVFSLTFLTSTWYVKNPFLKSKLVEASVAFSPLEFHELMVSRVDIIRWCLITRARARSWAAWASFTRQPSRAQAPHVSADAFLRRSANPYGKPIVL
jgi:hypothetical protein